MINVEHINKRFGQVEAVSDVSFQAKDGYVTGLLGPNGAGKSTTLRILYSVLQPTAGQALIDGYDSSRQAMEVRRRIGVLPHATGLYMRLTAKENIVYYGRLYGLSDTYIKERLDVLVDMFDLADILHRPTQGFSQGQKVKVALARALVHNPKNILLDEPTNGLDVMTTRALRQYIRQLCEAGICVLFSSHIMQEVAALCDEIVIINQGTVAISGSPDEIRFKTGYDNLEDAFVDIIYKEQQEIIT